MLKHIFFNGAFQSHNYIEIFTFSLSERRCYVKLEGLSDRQEKVTNKFRGNLYEKKNGIKHKNKENFSLKMPYRMLRVRQKKNGTMGNLQ